MSETKTEGLIYKGHPLRRIDNLIYYGTMADPYIVMMQILESKKENGLDMATKVSLQLQSTNPNVKARDRVVKKGEKSSLYAVSYTHLADGLADEPKVLTLGAYGDNMDFFALKGAVEAVLKQLRIENVRFLADSENPSYHPGRCAKVFSGDRLLGVLGQVHPHVAGNYGVDAELYAAELRFDALYESKGAQPVYQLSLIHI